jgi:hypothetical protein
MEDSQSFHCAGSEVRISPCSFTLHDVHDTRSTRSALDTLDGISRRSNSVLKERGHRDRSFLGRWLVNSDLGS